MKLLFYIYPVWLSGKESARQYRRIGFNPCIQKIPRRREWQPTPVFLPGEFHGQRSLAVYRSWDHKESDTTEQLTLHFMGLILMKRIWMWDWNWNSRNSAFRIWICNGKSVILFKLWLSELPISGRGFVLPVWMMGSKSAFYLLMY